MEARIKRGRLLREILKQDRLTPLCSRFQLAWLMAFNAGLFNDVKPEDITTTLGGIEQGIKASGLSLDSSQEQWLEALHEWLK